MCYNMQMKAKLSPLQSRVLALAQTRELSGMTYREIGEKLGGKHPYSIQQAIDGLVRKGYLIKNQKTKKVHLPQIASEGQKPFLNIPILGGVSCGPATEMAYDSPAGSVAVTPSVVSIRKPELTYALVASGESVTKAKINGKSVEHGDYVIVEKASLANVRTSSYVVARFNDLNNLKKLTIDTANQRFILRSEAEIDLPPIIIAEEDMQFFDIEGIAIDVVKGLPA